MQVCRRDEATVHCGPHAAYILFLSVGPAWIDGKIPRKSARGNVSVRGGTWIDPLAPSAHQRQRSSRLSLLHRAISADARRRMLSSNTPLSNAPCLYTLQQRFMPGQTAYLLRQARADSQHNRKSNGRHNAITKSRSPERRANCAQLIWLRRGVGKTLLDTLAPDRARIPRACAALTYSARALQRTGY